MIDFILKKCEAIASKISIYLWKIRAKRFYGRKKK
tara:strand:+ start:343 stop:447 length:105 start_codon:yes stop_codon:yes gene_type:complete